MLAVLKTMTCFSTSETRRRRYVRLMSKEDQRRRPTLTPSDASTALATHGCSSAKCNDRYA